MIAVAPNSVRKGLSLLEVIVSLAIFLLSYVAISHLVTTAGERTLDTQNLEPRVRPGPIENGRGDGGRCAAPGPGRCAPGRRPRLQLVDDGDAGPGDRPVEREHHRHQTDFFHEHPGDANANRPRSQRHRQHARYLAYQPRSHSVHYPARDQWQRWHGHHNTCVARQRQPKPAQR